MKAWIVDSPGPMAAGPLRWVDRAAPIPGPGELRIEVTACGVCRTDLHLAEGDLRPRSHGVTPGHEVVGYVAELGPNTSRFTRGDRVGVAWLRGTCGTCRSCRGGAENLCRTATFTGWDADGGYAEQVTAPETFVYPLTTSRDDQHVAPLLCAGIIGYRALRMAQLPAGGRLGIYGFGASAHLAAQVAMHQGATVHVMTRSAKARELALELGCASATEAAKTPPEPLDAAILFAPAGELVPVALSALDDGGTLAVAGIHLSDIPPLNYQNHLFRERTLRSVTANTRADGEEFLHLADAMDLQVHTQSYSLDRAAEALTDLAADRVDGAAVLLR